MGKHESQPKKQMAQAAKRVEAFLRHGLWDSLPVVGSSHPSPPNQRTPHKPQTPTAHQKQTIQRERKSSARGGGGSCRSFSLAPKTRHQPGPARRAPVARERWIGGWEAAALARRLLVLDSGCCERVVVSAGVRSQRGRGVRARAGAGRAGPKRPRDSARTAYLPSKS